MSLGTCFEVSDAELSAPSPAQGLPGCSHASRHDDNELNLSNCKLAPMKWFPLQVLLWSWRLFTATITKTLPFPLCHPGRQLGVAVGRRFSSFKKEEKVEGSVKQLRSPCPGEQYGGIDSEPRCQRLGDHVALSTKRFITHPRQVSKPQYC